MLLATNRWIISTRSFAGILSQEMIDEAIHVKQWAKEVRWFRLLWTRILTDEGHSKAPP